MGLPVSTEADFKTYRFGYEYDFVYRSRGFAGYSSTSNTPTSAWSSTTPIAAPEFTSAVAPIPTIGFVSRGYLAKNFAVGGEVSFFRIPGGLSEDYTGEYTDWDLYGTLNFTNNVGATAGYRSIDVFYETDRDSGALKFTGFYIIGVVRF